MQASSPPRRSRRLLCPWRSGARTWRDSPRPAPVKSGTTAPRVLIIAPTRELVVQIEADAHLLGSHTGFRILAVYGGIDYNKQREALREGSDVLVGTPGR